MTESIKYVKGLGYSRVIVLGHSLGVAAAICAADSAPNEIAGLVLLSGAYEVESWEEIVAWMNKTFQ